MSDTQTVTLPGWRASMLRTMRRYASSEALSDGANSWTYAQLERRVFEYCAGLAQAGLKPGDGVGLLGRNSLEYAALQIAVPLAGMYFMSLYELEGTQNHLAQIQYGKLRAVIVDPQTVPGRAEELHQATNGDVLILALGKAEGVADLLDLAARGSISKPVIDHNPHRVLELGLTGGTTGTAKGVIDTDKVYSAQALIHRANYELPNHPKMLLSTPLSHGIGSVALKSVLLFGGSVVLQSHFDPDRVLRTIEERRIDSLLLVPTSVYRILDSSEIGKRDTSSLQTLLYGGSPMSPDRVAEAIGRFGKVLVQQYGGREAKIVSVLGKEDHDPSRPDRLASAGQPMIGVQVALLDNDLQEVSQGEIGEICVRSPAAVSGYWENPEETAELHRGGWVHTGDLGVEDDEGFITIKDRIKQIIISGGHNVIPRDVEDAIAAHPDVAMAAVFGVPHADWGESVTAAVVRRPGSAVDAASLQAFVKARVGSVNTPKDIEFMDELPLTTAGKVDKKVLRAPFWSDMDRSVS